MKGGTRFWLAAALVVLMMILVAVFGREQQPASGPSTPIWLPGLKPALAEVRKVALQSSTQRVTLVKTAQGWGVEERAAYPVDFKRLEELLRTLSEANLLEQKTARPEFFGLLGLSDIEQPDSKAVLLELWGKAEQPLYRVMLGNRADGRNGRYVRDAGGTQSWLIDQAPDPLTDAADWIERRFVDVDFARVARVTRTPATGEGFTATRAAAGESSLQVAQIPKGRKIAYESVFDSAARALLSAQIEDVKPQKELAFDGPGVAHTQIDCFDGLRLEIDTLKHESGSWLRVRALQVPVSGGSGEEQLQNAAAQPAKTPTDTAPKSAAEVADEVARLNTQFGDWAFKVSDYVAGESAKPLADYLEEQKAQKTGDDHGNAG